MQVDVDRDVFDFLERSQVDNRYGVVISAVVEVSARVGNIEFAVGDGQFFGLVAYDNRVDDRKGLRVETIYGTFDVALSVGGSHVRADIGGLSVEADVSSVGNIYLGNVLGTVGCHNFNLVRTVHDGIKTTVVDFQVVARVAQFFDDGRVAFGVDVGAVNTG